MSLISDIKNKIGQFGSDVAQGTTDAYDAATKAVGDVFGTNSTQSTPAPGPQTTTGAVRVAQTNAVPLTALQAPGTTPQTPTPNRAIPVPQLPVKGATPVAPTQVNVKPVHIQTALNTLYQHTGGPIVNAATNTVKGNILLPAKSAYQQVVEHNEAASNATQAHAAATDIQGFGGAAAVPSYVIANKMAGNNPQLLKENLATLGLTTDPKKSGLKNTALTLGGETANSTIPFMTSAVSNVLRPSTALKLADINNIINAAKTNPGIVDAAKLLQGNTDDIGTYQQIAGGENGVNQTQGQEPLPGETPPQSAPNPAGAVENPPQAQSIPLETGGPSPASPASPSDSSGSSRSSLTQTSQDVNNEFPRNADAERAAIEEMQNTGDVDDAITRYAQVAGVDLGQALPEVYKALGEAKMLPSDAFDEAHAGPIEIPKGTPDKIAKAAQDIEDSYHTAQEPADDIEGLRIKAKNTKAEFARRGAAFEKAIGEELTPKEDTAVRDNLEGSAKPEEITPKVEAVTKVARQLNELGAKVLDKTNKTGFGRVKNYATRLYKSGLETPGATKAIKIKNAITDFLDTRSGFGEHREIGKFVAPQDGETRYGTQGSTGLRTNPDGDLVDKNGKIFKPTSVSTRELNENGFDYENSYGKTANAYHTSVGGAKGRFDAVQQIIRDPDKFGVHEEPSGTDVEITGVDKSLDGKYASKSTIAKLKKAIGPPETTGIVRQAIDHVNRTVQNLIMIVTNIHVINQAVQALQAAGKIPVEIAGHTFQGGPLALPQYIRTLSKYITDPEWRETATVRALRDGTVLADYGKNDTTVLTKALDKAGLPRVNKIGANLMEGVDNALRVTNHATADLAGDGRQAAKDINHFMGDESNVPAIARYTTIFYNYLRTTSRSLVSVANVKGNYGATANFALATALTLGAQQAFRDWTGNKHATVHLGGDIGTAHEILSAPGQIKQGNAPSIITNHINPVLTAAANQVYGKDLRTGATVGKGSANGGQSRSGNLVSTLVSPTQYTTKISNGKQSATQAAINLFTGSTLPHVAGAPAAPNFRSGPLSIVNTKGATPVASEGTGKTAIKDPTGIDQANLYYNAKTTALKAVQNDPEATDAINAYLDQDVNGKGQKVQHDPQQDIGVANLLAGTPAALSAMQNLQKAQPGHDPMWDLSTADLHEFLNYQGTRATDPTKQVKTDVDTGFNNGQGLTAFIKQRDAYYSNNNFTSTSQVAPTTPTYPTSATQNPDYVTYENSIKSGTSADKAAFLNAHPDVVDVMNQLNNYYNALGVSQGGNAIKQGPQLTAGQETALQAYDALPTGTGARTAWINAHPDEWNQITSTLAQDQLQTVSEEGARNQYVGESPTDTFLGGIANLGQDIASTTNPDGSKSYSLNPQEAYAQQQAASQSQFKPLVPLPKYPKKNKVKVRSIKKVYPRRIKVRQNPRVHVQTSGGLNPVKIAKPASVLKIA